MNWLKHGHIVNCNKSAMVVRKISQKCNSCSIYQDLMRNLRNSLNCKCKSLSNCGTNKTGVGNLGGEGLLYTEVVRRERQGGKLCAGKGEWGWGVGGGGTIYAGVFPWDFTIDLVPTHNRTYLI